MEKHSEQGHPHSGESAPQALPSLEIHRMWSQFSRLAETTLHHQILRRFLGNWRLSGELDICGYGPNFSAEGTARGALCFGGRFLEMDWQLSTVHQTWDLRLTMGYDPVMEKYHLTLIESNHNGITVVEGDWHEPTRSLRFWGEQSNPMFNRRHDVLINFTMSPPHFIHLTMRMPDLDGVFKETMHLTLCPARGEKTPG